MRLAVVAVGTGYYKRKVVLAVVNVGPGLGWQVKLLPEKLNLLSKGYRAIHGTGHALFPVGKGINRFTLAGLNVLNAIVLVVYKANNKVQLMAGVEPA